MAVLTVKAREFLAEEFSIGDTNIELFTYLCKYYEGYEKRFDISKNEYDKVIKEKRESIVKPLIHSRDEVKKRDLFFSLNRNNFRINKIKEIEYSQIMKNEILYRIKGLIEEDSNLLEKEQNRKAYNIISNISAEEILNNKLSKNYLFNGRKYQKGMKTTKLVTKITKIQKHSMSYIESLVGRLKVNPTDLKGEIYMSILPEAFITAGITGDSCLSPDGENEHAALLLPLYKNSIVFYNEDFSWRMFGFVDNKNKSFSLLSGFPVQNYFSEATVYNLFLKLGYKDSDGYNIQAEGYIDKKTLFEYAREKEKNQMEINFIENHRELEECLYTSVKLSSSNSDYDMINAKLCQSCDKTMIGERDINNISDDYFCNECYQEEAFYCEARQKAIMKDNLECYIYSYEREAFDNTIFEFLAPSLEFPYMSECPGVENCPFHNSQEKIKKDFYSTINKYVGKQNSDKKKLEIVENINEGNVILEEIGREDALLSFEEYKKYEGNSKE